VLVQSRATLEKPMSLPPIWIVTILVFALSELNCGGLGPSGSTFCGFVMSSVSAPLQLGSVNASPSWRDARCE
jgi:hypothetical protein